MNLSTLKVLAHNPDVLTVNVFETSTGKFKISVIVVGSRNPKNSMLTTARNSKAARAFTSLDSVHGLLKSLGIEKYSVHTVES